MLNMKKSEIVREYKSAKNKKEQIKILADLNCTTQTEIKSILREAGLEPVERKKKIAPIKVVEEITQDDCVEEIEEIPDIEYPGETVEAQNSIPMYVRRVLEDELISIEHRIKHLEESYREIATFLCS